MISDLGEDSFFDALFHIMWNMETDIFSEPEKTLALLADLVPKCKKQRNRMKMMYECGAMGYIENAVANRDEYEINLKRAVRQLVDEVGISVDKSIFAVNCVIALWDEDLEKIEEYDENEDLDEDFNADEDDEFVYDEDEEEYDIEDEEDGDEDMIFMQDVATDENTEPEVHEDEAASEETAEEAGDSEPKIALVKKILDFWCEGEFEEERPYMFACPIGWILILLCCVLGGFMIYDIPLGDKFVVPTFAFMFSVLTSKRLYRYESTGRFSILIALFYLIAMFRALWIGGLDITYRCVPIAAAALLVFNSGRVSTWLDESKCKSFVAYLLIIVFSSLITVGVYAIQNVTV